MTRHRRLMYGGSTQAHLSVCFRAVPRLLIVSGRADWLLARFPRSPQGHFSPRQLRV